MPKIYDTALSSLILKRLYFFNSTNSSVLYIASKAEVCKALSFVICDRLVAEIIIYRIYSKFLHLPINTCHQGY